MIDPVTGMLIATAISTAVKGIGEGFAHKKAKKAAKLRSKETKRETLSGLLDDALYGSAELQSHGLDTTARKAKKKTEGMQNTADLVRGAFNI